MSIHAISQYYHIPWSTVKNIEKRYLQTKFKTIPLKKVKVIGIDEIAIGRKKGKPVYWTIVRDLVSGRSLPESLSEHRYSHHHRRASPAACQ